LEKVAIVGSGPSGLTAGWELAKRGYKPTIFEAESVAGGMLSWGIPEYRLPKDVIDYEIKYIKDMGVEIKTNTPIGKDLSIEDLFNQGYKAVYIATGDPVNLKLQIPGEEVEGVIDPIEFLKKYNLEGDAKIGKKVAVIGGGNTAMDAARTAWRLGADVTILYRRTRPEMPANDEEIKEALEEGIKIEYLTLPIEAYTDNGRLSEIKCIRMELTEFDDTGRRRPKQVEGSEFELEVDTLIPAIGQVPDLEFLNGKKEIHITKWNTLEVDPETMATNVPGIFAGGDVVSGPATVLEAMRSGKIAGESIHKHLRGENLEREYTPTVPRLEVPLVELTPEEAAELNRPEIPCIPAEARKGSFKEVELALSKEMCMKEAKRCLRCDLESKGGSK
jgi:NADPH-dependent glutamate synthase beta subunit-like oxidoreductase